MGRKSLLFRSPRKLLICRKMGKNIIHPYHCDGSEAFMSISKAEGKKGGFSFEHFFALNLDLLAISDMQGTLLKVNEAWTQVLGYSEKELEGRVILDFVHPDDRKDIQRALDELSEQKNVFGRIHRYQAKDGSCRYIEWSSKVDNDLIYIAARDITEKKIVEEQLLEREKSFRSFVDSYQDILIVGKRTGEIEYANPAALRKLGYSKEKLRQMCLRDLREDEKTDCLPALKKSDGTLLPVETMEWAGIWNGKDCIVAVSKDLSMQQAVLERFQQLFDNNPALMAISNAEDNRLLDVNAAFLEKLGFTKEEVIGRTSIELNIFDDPNKKLPDTQILPRNQKIKNLELRVRRKDGQMIDGLFSGDLIRNQTEKVFLTVMMDITEQKEAQRQLAKQAGLILSLLDSIPELVFLQGCKRRLPWLQSDLCRVFRQSEGGYRRKDRL